MGKVLAALAATALALAGAVTIQLATEPRAAALENGLAKTPPMGWNDWNAFRCGVTEALVEKTADTFVTSGLKAAGYQYVNIDDCWALPDRDASGALVPNPSKFPDGMKAVVDYVHAKGLKFGIYEDSGTRTCSKGGGFSGSLGHEYADALQFAQWGVDYLKYDDCNIPADGQNQASTIQRYETMRDALAAATRKTGHPIVFSICEKTDYGVPNSTWPPVGNLWRTTFDIHDQYSRMLSIFHINVQLAALAGPGGWNDPDMLEIGNGGMTGTEYRTEFSLWSEMAAPLIAGTDVTKATPATLAIYTNRGVIGVDQDRLGRQGVEVSAAGGLNVMTRPLANGDRAVVLFNETDAPAVITTTASQVGLGRAPAYRLHDLWTGRTTETAGTISAQVPPHAVVMDRVSRALPFSSPPDATLTMAGVDALAPGVPGQVTEIFTDNGVLPALFGRLSLTAPTGWAVRATSPTSFPVVGGGRAVQATWQVTEPVGTTGTTTFTGTADYRWPGPGTVTVTNNQDKVG